MAKFFGKESKYLIQEKRKYIRIFTSLFSITVIILILILTVQLFNIKNYYFNYFLAFLSIPIYFMLKKIGGNYAQKGINYKSGVRGEAVASRILQTLPDDYTVFQDIKIPDKKGNVDFVVLGNKDVFVVEVKNHPGVIRYKDGRLYRYNKLLEKNIINQTLNEALSLREYLFLKSGEALFIHPILLFSNNRAKLHLGKKKYKGIYIIQAGWLKELIEDINTTSRKKINQELIEKHLKDLVVN